MRLDRLLQKLQKCFGFGMVKIWKVVLNTEEICELSENWGLKDSCKNFGNTCILSNSKWSRSNGAIDHEQSSRREPSVMETGGECCKKYTDTSCVCSNPKQHNRSTSQVWHDQAWSKSRKRPCLKQTHKSTCFSVRNKTWKDQNKDRFFRNMYVNQTWHCEHFCEQTTCWTMPPRDGNRWVELKSTFYGRLMGSTSWNHYQLIKEDLGTWLLNE